MKYAIILSLLGIVLVSACTQNPSGQTTTLNPNDITLSSVHWNEAINHDYVCGRMNTTCCSDYKAAITLPQDENSVNCRLIYKGQVYDPDGFSPITTNLSESYYGLESYSEHHIQIWLPVNQSAEFTLCCGFQNYNESCKTDLLLPLCNP